MNIAIHLSNQLLSEAIYQLLVTHGYDAVVMGGSSPTNGFTPHVLLVDSTTLKHDLLARYPRSKGPPRGYRHGTGQAPCHAPFAPDTRGTPHTYGTLPLQEGPRGNRRGKAMDRRRDDQDVVPRWRGHLTEGDDQPYHEQGTGDHRLHLPGVEQQRDRAEAHPLTAHGEDTPQHLLQEAKFNFTKRSKLMTLATQRPRSVSV